MRYQPKNTRNSQGTFIDIDVGWRALRVRRDADMMGKLMEWLRTTQ